MTYKRQMEKAIKEYMSSIGFKYYTPRFTYFKKVNDDTLFRVGYATASGYEKEFYELSIYACTIYRSWNNLLYQLTDGFCDFDSWTNGPVSFPTRLTWQEKQVVFTGTRSMEENLADYKEELETRALPFLERYTNREILYQDMVERPDDIHYLKNLKWYMPIAHYVNGTPKAALQHVEMTLKECEQDYRENPQAPAYIRNLHDFTLYRKNLLRLIEGWELPPRHTPSAVSQILQKLYKK